MSKSNNKNTGFPILGQLLSFIPSEIFKKVVEEESSDKYYKKLKTWDHFVFMFYGILTGSSSLREIITNFALFSTKLAHCRIFEIPARSTVSDANKNRTTMVFGRLYLQLYLFYQEYLSDSYLHMKINGEIDPKTVEIFDSTTVSLFNDVFKNTGRIPLNGRKKGGIKAFTKITLAERVPNFICLKSATTNERLFLSELSLTPGTIAVFDKGFQKFNQYQQWNQSGVFYVTRMNKNARFKIVNQRPLDHSIEQGVQMDADIELSYSCPKSKENITVQSRMITFIDPESNKKLIFLSNLLDVKADTIALLYKNRWTIEPLFKQIKQNFELTYFLSESENGIKTQIWIAMILNLVFTVIHKMIKEAEDFRTMIRVAAKNAGSYIGFVKFLKNKNEVIGQIKRDIKIVQLEIFDSAPPPYFYNSEINTS